MSDEATSTNWIIPNTQSATVPWDDFVLNFWDEVSVKEEKEEGAVVEDKVEGWEEAKEWTMDWDLFKEETKEDTFWGGDLFWDTGEKEEKEDDGQKIINNELDLPINNSFTLESNNDNLDVVKNSEFIENKNIYNSINEEENSKKERLEELNFNNQEKEDESSNNFRLSMEDDIVPKEELENKDEKDEATDTKIETVKQPDLWQLLWWNSDISGTDNQLLDSNKKLSFWDNWSSADLGDLSNINSTQDNNQNSVPDNDEIKISSIDWNTWINNETNGIGNQENQSKNLENLGELSQDVQVSQDNQNIKLNAEWNNIDNNTNAETVSNVIDTWVVRSTLSLDQILDSELLSNPQFADTSTAIPKNVSVGSGFFSKYKTAIIAWIWILVLAWFVSVLAFPSTTADRKDGDVVIEDTTPTIMTEDIDWWWSFAEEQGFSEIVDDNPQRETTHWVPNTIELFPEETVDDNDNDKEEDFIYEDSNNIDENSQSSEGIPYIPTDYSEQESVDIDSWSSEISDILLKISSFKMQGETYKQLWDSESNTKVVKYALYVIQLCDTYETQVVSWEWLDDDSYAAFEAKVQWFISKIEKNLGGIDDVTVVYSQDSSNE